MGLRPLGGDGGLLPLGVARAAAVPSALWFWYAFDEASGAALDSGPYKLDVPQIGTIPSVAGKVGTARAAAGSGNYLNLTGIAPGYTLYGKEFTLVTWVYPLQIQLMNTFLIADAPGNRVLGQLCNGVSGVCYPLLRYESVIGPSSIVDSTVPYRFPLNAWTFLAFRLQQDGNAALWVNATQGSYTGKPAPAALDFYDILFFYITATASRLDELALWASLPGGGGALTDSQIAWLYNSGTGRAFSELATMP